MNTMSPLSACAGYYNYNPKIPPLLLFLLSHAVLTTLLTCNTITFCMLIIQSHQILRDALLSLASDSFCNPTRPESLSSTSLHHLRLLSTSSLLIPVF